MRAYYGSRFSPNMTATPEGFLIAHNVPIARTGWYEYLGEEIGAQDRAGQIVKVYRSPDEVFSDAAMASFEGKVLTDEHPPSGVSPDNATRYSRGAVQNVRRGTGEDADLLLADLVVHDKTLINEIQDGKREVSCGYECEYEALEDGTYQQRQICGNHVAVVSKGRAGDRVAIKDSEPRKGAIKMPKMKKGKGNMTAFLAAIGLKQFAADAEPEEIVDAMNAMADESGIEEEEETKDNDPIQALSAKVDQLAAVVAQLAKGAAAEPDPIDEAITQLGAASADNEEESHTIPAESIDEAGPVSSPEDRPKDPITGDNGAKIAALRALKPAIAAISDPAERKRVADAAIAAFASKPANPGAYGKIQGGARKAAIDSQKQTPTQTVDQSHIGKAIAKRCNPHYKDRD